jgi:hypothetical protein
MSYTKNIITLILVLLLANPACCCALNGCGAPEKAPVRSCCSGTSDDQEDKDDPKDEHKCMCSLNNQYTDHEKLSLTDPHFSLLPDPPVIFLDADRSVPTCIVDQPRMKRPPSGPPIRILFSVFRL